MSVKRYRYDFQSGLVADDKGGLVSYADYEKLAAENAGMKAAELDEIEVINRGGQAYCVKDGMSVNPIYARGWNDYRAKSLSVETPATDAFLAEVRAQGVEAFANSLKVAGGGEHPYSSVANEFAAQLRKGVQS
ncbi:hypothetical protein ACYQP7_002699 [Enterobacter hormaechei]